jgi:ATP-binding cassette subfamily B protein RaxB
VRLIRQSEAAECGLACLAMVAQAHGAKVDLNGLRTRFGLSLKGTTLRALMRMANEIGLGTRALRLEPEHLGSLKLPSILHWDLNHFVVLKSVGRQVTILDPASSERRLSPEEVSKHFTGVALELTPAADFAPPEMRARTRLRDLWSRLTGWKRAATQLVILSLILQLAALAFPFFLQLAIDQAVTNFDLDFLLLLAFGFGALHIVNAATTALRAWVILTLGQAVSFQMVGNVFRHLLRLPADFFEKRHVGDIVSRMGSTQPIQNALTESVVASLIDALMLMITAFVIFIYSWQLALVTVVATGLYLALALGLFPLMRMREDEEIAARAVEQTHLVESIRALRTIKMFGREAEREGRWRNLFADVINAGVRRGRLDIILTFGQTLIFGLQTVVIVYLGARMIIVGDGFSVGMLFAFMSYRQQFADRAVALVQHGIEFRMLGLHLERLSDIVQASRESGLETTLVTHRKVQGAIDLDQISFRYGPGEPVVLEDVSLKVEQGEFIAIAGPSGSGKSTLLKIILGLLPPTGGELRVDGVPLDQFGRVHWREGLGVVAQDDQLLSGTLAENIAFFDPEIDMQRVLACAQAARIHEDIERMPMNYYSFVGDMGMALSGGQRQRVLLARALYHRPRVLVLDEGTANLDIDLEQQIADVVAGLDITRIVVAHRPELLRRADRVFVVNCGQLVELSHEARTHEFGDAMSATAFKNTT